MASNSTSLTAGTFTGNIYSNMSKSLSMIEGFTTNLKCECVCVKLYLELRNLLKEGPCIFDDSNHIEQLLVEFIRCP